MSAFDDTSSAPARIAARIHAAIDEVTTAVEDIHRTIAAVPLAAAAAARPLAEPAAEIRDLHDRSISAAYDLVRHVNRRIGALTAEILKT
jgi:hypothetical protein